MPLALGCEQRFATPAQVTAIAMRDGGCAFPGCDAHIAWLDTHHADEWGDGAPPPAGRPGPVGRRRAGFRSVGPMQIVSALFIEEIELRQVPGPSTRIDLTGIQFSAPAPGPFPVTVTPHMVVLVRNGEGEDPNGALEVVFFRDGDQIARNVQPIDVEPGKFAYRLVRAELEFPTPAPSRPTAASTWAR